MKFFVDNNLGESLVRGMKGFGVNICHLKDHFPENAPDTTWIPFVGENNYFLITRDLRLRWHPAELQSLYEYNVGSFFLAGKDRTKWQLIQQLVRHWLRINDFALKTKRPFAFNIPSKGTKIIKIPIQNFQ